MGCPNECLHFHGPWITAGLGSADLYKHGETDSQQIFQLTSLGSNKALLFLNANFTISRDLRGFHPSRERHILSSVPCNAQGHSHLSMFRRDWQQHAPGDRGFSSALKCVCIPSCTQLRDQFSLRSIIVVLVAGYIAVAATPATKEAVHMPAGASVKICTYISSKKTLSKTSYLNINQIYFWCLGVKPHKKKVLIVSTK